MRRGLGVLLAVGVLGAVGCGAGAPSLSLAESDAFSRDRTAIIAVTHRTPAGVGQWRRRCRPLLAAPTAVQQRALARVTETVTTRGDHLLVAVGCIAGSACLGMLIPPSVLMIVWAVVTETSIGDLFMAGIMPGFLVMALYCGYIIMAARLTPERVGEGPRPRSAGAAASRASNKAQGGAITEIRERMPRTLFRTARSIDKPLLDETSTGDKSVTSHSTKLPRL